jgi:hypothetical protein
MRKERLITDLDRQGPNELAGLVLENKKDVVKRRINPFVLEFDENGEPTFPCRKDEEYLGLLDIGKQAKRFDYIVWLSPKGGKYNYPEGRVVVGKVVNRENGMKIECRGIPCLMDREEMVEAGNMLGGDYIDPEELRERSIGMLCWNEEDFWQRCEEALGMEEVWEAIRNGEDVRLKEEVVKVVTEVRQQIQGNDIWAIAAFEKEIIRRGYEYGGGNHGGMTMNHQSAFGIVFNKAEIGLKAERVGGKIVCPCGEALKEGVTKCPKCGLKISLA